MDLAEEAIVEVSSIYECYELFVLDKGKRVKLRLSALQF